MVVESSDFVVKGYSILNKARPDVYIYHFWTHNEGVR